MKVTAKQLQGLSKAVYEDTTYEANEELRHRGGVDLRRALLKAAEAASWGLREIEALVHVDHIDYVQLRLERRDFIVLLNSDYRVNDHWVRVLVQW